MLQVEIRSRWSILARPSTTTRTTTRWVRCMERLTTLPLRSWMATTTRSAICGALEWSSTFCSAGLLPSMGRISRSWPRSEREPGNSEAKSGKASVVRLRTLLKTSSKLTLTRGSQLIKHCSTRGSSRKSRPNSIPIWLKKLSDSLQISKTTQSSSRRP